MPRKQQFLRNKKIGWSKRFCITKKDNKSYGRERELIEGFKFYEKDQILMNLKNSN